MSAHQMICHLSDALRSALREKYVSPSNSLLQRTILKPLALWVKTGAYLTIGKALHPRIFPQEEQHHVDAVPNSMRDDRHGQVAPRPQIDHSQQKSHQPFVDDARPALIGVGQRKSNVNHNQADDPGAPGANRSATRFIRYAR